MLVNAGNVKKMFSERVLFDDASFNIEEHDKIGLIGANGAGKSTLFKILTGEEDYEAGEIFKNKNLKIGYLNQYSCSGSKLTLFDELLTAYSDVLEMEKELEEINLELSMNTGETELLVKRQNELNECLEEREGFFYRNKVKSTLLGLGFSEEELSLTVDKLSGGQKTRVELGKILLSDANLLILDEPTNHLDIASVEWLEDFLKAYRKAFVVISHDRYFLDNVTEKTFEIENGRFYSFNGSYTEYVKQREIIRLTEERKYENTKKEIERLEGIVEQQRRWNREKNIKTAESKQKIIDKLEKDLIVPEKQKENMFYDFKAYAGGGRDVLSVSGLGISFEKKRLFSNVDMFLKKGEKVFLTGPNGIGKTTLLKIILGEIKQTEGSFKLGTDIHIGYYDQIQEKLSVNKTIFDEISDEYPALTNTEIRNALAGFRFTGDEVFREIKTLSGGERARVALCKLIMKRVNLLIMDEPTNHLDIAAREALEQALSEYGGTMLMVSHDRYFINKLADRIIYLSSEGAESFLGNYDEFLKKKKLNIPEEKKKEEKGMDYRERKRKEAAKRKALNDFKKCEERILICEEETLKLNEELTCCGADFVKAAEISEKIALCDEELSELYRKMELLEKELEEME